MNMEKLSLFTASIILSSGAAFAQNCGAIPNPAAVAGYSKQTVGGPISLGKNWEAIPGANVVTNPDGSVTISGGGSAFNNQIGTKNITGGFYAEATLSWKGAGTWKPGIGWPAFWATNTAAGLGMSNVEVDFMESMSGTNNFDFGMHNWNPDGSDTATNPAMTGTPGPVMNAANKNTYGFLFVPATASAPGTAEWFVNGKQVGKSVPIPQNGLFSTLNTQPMSILLGTGQDNPMTVYSASVWQASGTSDYSYCGTSAPVPGVVSAGTKSLTPQTSTVSAQQSVETPASVGASPTVTAAIPADDDAENKAEQLLAQNPAGVAAAEALLGIAHSSATKSTVSEPTASQIPVGTATQSTGRTAFATQAAVPKPSQAGSGRGTHQDDPDGLGDADD